MSRKEKKPREKKEKTPKTPKAPKVPKEKKKKSHARREALEKEHMRQNTDGHGHEYDRSGEIPWGKLDNSAHLFPAIAGEGMSNVYRVAVYLNEDIVPETLQEALDMVLPKFPTFNCRLRQGMFWYYFEENGKAAPKVVEENTYPCRYIRENENRSYLFRVTYYKKRINMEAFHVLTDGTGAMAFLKELAYQYLRLAHPDLREKCGDHLSSHTSLNTEDSFLENVKKGKFSKGYKSFRAYLLKGSLFPTGKMGIIHGHMPVDEVKKRAKEYGATINEYLVSVFAWSVYKAYLKGSPGKHPITVAVPVNLRPYFDSVTSKNFFVMVTAVFSPEREDMDFAEVVGQVRSSLAEQTKREHLEEILAYNVAGERTMILRTIPLIFKNPGLKGIYNLHAKANTSTLTNLGEIKVAEPYREYIERFDVLLSRSKGQNLKLTVHSYNGVLSVTITSVMRDDALQRKFFKYLAAQGIPVTIQTNGVY